MKFDVEFYVRPDGSIPMEDFLDSLDDKMAAKVFRTIDLLADYGTQLREPYSKYLVDNILELRIKVGSNISRVLYFFVIEHKIILTNGFIKKSTKTPRAEIELAKTYRNEYLERRGLK